MLEIIRYYHLSWNIDVFLITVVVEFSKYIVYYIIRILSKTQNDIYQRYDWVSIKTVEVLSMFNMIPFGRGRRNALANWDDFFNTDFFNPTTSMNQLFRADVKETDSAYKIQVDVPGMDKKDIQIHYMNNQLTVHGKRSADTEVKEENYIRRERSFGEFSRSFYVDNVDEEKISASFEDGVLTITLPKLEKEMPKGRQIDID